MFRENIFEFISKDEEAVLYLPKNKGLFTAVDTLLGEIGLAELREVARDIQAKKSTSNRSGNLFVELARGEDVPQRVNDSLEGGMLAYGITGDDLFDEWRFIPSNEDALAVLNTYDWLDSGALYGAPTLCVINKTGSLDDIMPDATIALNKKYERTSKRSLQSRFPDASFKFLLYAGDTEKAVESGTASAGVEIVYSGKSLEETGLDIAWKVRRSDFALIGRNPGYLGRVLEKDFAQITQRAKNPSPESYTSGLLASQKAYRDKFAAESMEVFSAIERGNKPALIGELCDLLYAANVVMVGEGISQYQVAREMKSRLK
ncbi:MAG: phosphoribosyl-ATP diphosphatase [Candidatus Woesearchaeota archaeon]